MKIIFEDPWIIAVEKPSGLPSHSLKTSDTSAESLLNESLAPHTALLLHRLDTGTSGVLLFAKDKNTYEKMREKFKLREIHKEYLAWTESTPDRLMRAKELHFPQKIELPLAHHPKSAKRMIPLAPEKNAEKKLSYRGKPLPALTWIDGFRETSWQGIASLEFKIRIPTGVMHQIRVHLKWLGFPLIGDPIYGDESSKSLAASQRIDLGLQAKRVEFKLNKTAYDITSHVDASHKQAK